MIDSARPRLEAVFLDLDGSLLGPGKEIGQKDRETVRRLREAGVRVVLATGRHYELSARYHRELGLSGPFLASDGAVLYDREGDRVLWDRPIPQALISRVLEEALRLGEEFYLHDREAAYFSPHFSRIGIWRDYAAGCGPEDRHPALAPLPEGYAASPHVMTFMADRPSPAFLARLRELCGGLDSFYVSPAGEVAILGSPGWDKGKGARLLAEEEGFSLENALALGDSGNDLPLLREVGWPVVPAGGSPDALALARFVTAESGHDPLTRAVESLFASP